MKDYQESQRLFSKLVNKTAQLTSLSASETPVPYVSLPCQVCMLSERTLIGRSLCETKTCGFRFFCLCGSLFFLPKVLNVQHSITKLKTSLYFALFLCRKHEKKRLFWTCTGILWRMIVWGCSTEVHYCLNKSKNSSDSIDDAGLCETVVCSDCTYQPML